MFIVKIPGIDGEGKTNGCERAGNAIIKELKNLHSNEQNIPIDSSLLDLEEIHLDNFNLKLTHELIYKNSLETFETKSKTIFLGGDQSISHSTLKAFSDYCKKENKKPCLIVFDSHPDCLSSKREFPDSRAWLRRLIETGFPKENILIVGLRNCSKEEITFLAQNKISSLSLNAITEDLREMCDTIMEFSNGKELYVSIDIDVIDPVFAPSTAYPESGGLTSRQFLYLIQRIKKVKNLRAVDICEINELEDKKKDNLTVKLGAKILAELI